MQNVIFDNDGEFINVTIAVNKVFATSGDGLYSNKQKAVKVNDITITVAIDEDENSDGDLGINYSTKGWVIARDGLIYTDSYFLKCLHKYLIAQGFNADAVNDIDYSEQGMQDDGRVSCDAYEFAALIREMLATA